jgi:hypothetical protein
MVDVEPMQSVVDCLAELPDISSGFQF